MEDTEIISMLWKRDESAITMLERSHKKMCVRAASEITGSASDAEECFSDACLAVWNSIPPEKPTSLRAYILRVCRNLALNVVRAKNRQKRSAVLVELDECVSEAIPDMEPREIGIVIDEFLEKLPRLEAIIFVRRYNCSEPVKDIAAAVGLSENQVSKKLQKLRRRLKKCLEERGIEI